jgi:cellulose biosynthesis protein BcsQ
MVGFIPIIPRKDARDSSAYLEGRSMKLSNPLRFFLSRIRRRKENSLTVLYASARPVQGVLDALHSQNLPIRVYEAISAEGVIRGITPETDLVIFDGADTVLASNDCPAGSLQRTLADLAIPIATQLEFLAQPDEMLGRALLARGNRVGLQHLASRFVLVTGFTGGVGKTTLSMTLARRFRESRRPAALLEAGLGLSTILRRTRVSASLYDIYTGQSQPDRWEGVDIFPAAEEAASVLAGEKESLRRGRFLDGLRNDYALVVVDAFPRHPLWPYLLAYATDVLIVATPLEEILAQAEELQLELRHSRTSAHLHLVINKTRTTGERLGLADSLRVTFDETRAQRFDPSLADPILEALYPGWKRVRRPAASTRTPLLAQEPNA